MTEIQNSDETLRVAPLILHLSADYPDPHRVSRKTTAIQRLVERTAIEGQVVVSLIRTSLPWKTRFNDCGEINGVRLYSYRYFGLPMGFGLAGSMRRVAKQVRRVMEKNHRSPDLVHAHKFSFEGIAGLALVEGYGSKTRFFVSVRGESERKVLLFKPNYSALMRRIAKRADKIYHVSAWFCDTFHKTIPEQTSKERLLPNIVGNTTKTVPVAEPEPRFVSVFDLNYRKRKGLSDLLRGFAEFQRSHPEIGLDLIGPGDPENVEAAEKEIAALGLTESVRILGPMNAEQLFATLPNYLAMALVSYNETFGMVYLESLFAGIPILYGRETGIDGYLNDVQVGVGTKPGNVPGIAQGLADLYLNNAAYRQGVVDAGPVLHRRFDPEVILSTYREDIDTCCPTNSEEILAK